MKTIHIDASDYYGGTIYGHDDNGQLWEREPINDNPWHSEDGMETLQVSEVKEDWFNK